MRGDGDFVSLQLLDREGVQLVDQIQLEHRFGGVGHLGSTLFVLALDVEVVARTVGLKDLEELHELVEGVLSLEADDLLDVHHPSVDE